MALFYDYKHVSEEQFQELEEQLEPEVLKSKLFDVLGISYDDERKLKICMKTQQLRKEECLLHLSKRRLLNFSWISTVAILT